MALRVLHAMFLVRGIEVGARRRKTRGVALTVLVDVDGVNSRTVPTKKAELGYETSLNMFMSSGPIGMAG